MKNLNNIVPSINFVSADVNLPSAVVAKYLKNYQLLKMSSADMVLFIRYFRLMIGDFDKVWPFYIYLRIIIGIAMSLKMAKSDILLLEYYA